MSKKKSKVRVGEYEVGEVIGSGSFSTVYRGVHVKTKLDVAIKSVSREKLDSSKKHQENLDSEIEIMKRLKHDNVVELYDLYTTETNIFLVLELCKGGDLSSAIKRNGGRFEEIQVKRMLSQIAKGLAALHEQNLIHRDLKPQNLLLTGKDVSMATVKIADFGFAKHIQPDAMIETLCGSPLYMAPEILKFEKYDAKADLWSVGTILFELLCGEPPFRAINSMELLRVIESRTFSVPSSIQLSKDCHDILQGLLERDPAKRMGFDAFFSHSFLDLKGMDESNPSLDELEFVLVDEDSLHLRRSKSLVSKESISIKKSVHNFNFSLLSESAVYEEFRLKLNQAQTIAALASEDALPNYEESGLSMPMLDQSTSSVAILLFVEVLEKLKSLVELISEYRESKSQRQITDKFSGIEAKAIALFEGCMGKVMVLRETIEIECIHHNIDPSQIYVDSTKSILFTSALKKGDEAAVDESFGEFESARDKYTIAGSLLRHLYESGGLKDSEPQEVHRLIKAFDSRKA